MQALCVVYIGLPYKKAFTMNSPDNSKIIENHLDDEKRSLGKPQLDLSNESISNYDFHQINISGEKWLRWYLVQPKFQNTSFKDCSFDTIRFENGVFDNSSFDNVLFRNCFFINCSFVGVDLNKVIFKDRVCINGIVAIGAKFVECDIVCDGSNVNFENSIVIKSKFIYSGSNAVFKYMNFDNSEITFKKNSAHTEKDRFDLRGATIKSCKIIDSVVPPSTIFENSDLSNSKIINSTFIKCNFRKAKLFGIELSNDVIVNSTDFTEAEIDRYSLECITKDQIPNSSRVKLKVKDDIATLRLMYSGAYRFINLVLLLLFIAPYFWFTGKLWLVAKFHPAQDSDTISMIGALGRYIVSGGQYWEYEWIINWFPMTLFFIAISYNSSRLILLMKTISLEHQEKVKGLPIKFNIKVQPWQFIYKANLVLFFINIMVVILHTYYFFLQKVPTGSS
jgi:uncharacterized protein YjbI with pentapeptide repeats